MQWIRSRKLLGTPVFEVHEAVIRDAGGRELRRSLVTHAGSAVVLPMDAEGRVLLVSQYRAPVKGKVWELPAGRIDAGEKPLAAAKRELAEETGLRARKWRRLAVLYPSPGYVAETMHLYLATGLRQGEQAPEEDEDLELRWFTRRELERMIDRGKVPDAKTLAGLMLAWRSSRLDG